MVAKGYVATMGLVSVAALVLALLAMVSTNPIGIGPLGVTAWFLVVLAGLSAAFSLVVYWVQGKLQPKLPVARRKLESGRRGLFLGSFVTVIVALSSLRQLNARDILLIGLLLLLVEFYLVARS